MNRYRQECLAQQSGAALGELVGGVFGLAFGALRLGAFAARNAVEGLAWGVPPAARGHCATHGCCEVHHHYLYHHVPDSHCDSCGCR